MTERIYLITPPMREAIRELAEAYVDYVFASERRGVGDKFPKEAERLVQAQAAFCIELIDPEEICRKEAA